MIYGTAEPPYPAHVERVRSAERQVEDDLVQEYDGRARSEHTGSFTFSLKYWYYRQNGVTSRPLFVLPGPCDPECSDSGCEGPGPQRCITCLRFFLKFKNNTRLARSHAQSRRRRPAVTPDPSVRQGVCVRVPQGVLGRPAPLQKMLLLLRALQREPQRPVHLLSGRSPPGRGHQHVHGRLRGRLLPGPR